MNSPSRFILHTMTLSDFNFNNQKVLQSWLRQRQRTVPIDSRARNKKKQVGKMGVGMEVGAPPRQQTGTNCRDFEYRKCFSSRARFFCRLSSTIHTTKSKRTQNAFESGHSFTDGLVETKSFGFYTCSVLNCGIIEAFSFGFVEVKPVRKRCVNANYSSVVLFCQSVNHGFDKMKYWQVTTESGHAQPFKPFIAK